MTIGERIRSVRKEKGLTQRALGQLLGVTQATVGQYETNPNPPKIETLQRIATALGVPVVDLLGPYDGPSLPGLVNGDEMEEVGPFRYSPPRVRINAAVDQMTPEGQSKVADYAEDILPRYRRQGVAQPTQGGSTEDYHEDEWDRYGDDRYGGRRDE